jgi:hypothetical protein
MPLHWSSATEPFDGDAFVLDMTVRSAFAEVSLDDRWGESNGLKIFSLERDCLNQNERRPPGPVCLEETDAIPQAIERETSRRIAS